MSTEDALTQRRRAIVKTLLYCEGGLLLSLAAWLIVLTLFDESTELAPLLGEVGFASLGALGLIASGHAFARGRNYGRAPAVIANLIALGVAYYQVQGAFWIGAIIICALALPTLYFAIRIVPQQ